MFGNLTQLVDSYSTGGWIYYGLVFGGLLIMRVTYRKVKRPFKVCKSIHITSDLGLGMVKLTTKLINVQKLHTVE